jgi:hypothetical protein
VCKPWRGIVSDPQFISRFRKHHRKPPLLGFFAGLVGATRFFTPVLESPNRIPAARFFLPQSHHPRDQWRFLGCRHGLAILANEYQHEVIVWDPLTGQQHNIPFPPGLRNNKSGPVWRCNAAVLCADSVDGHVHGDCFSSPFKLVLACGGYKQINSCLYDSVSRAWGDIVSMVTAHGILPIRSNVLIGNTVYWLLSGKGILAFDTETQTLCEIENPVDAHCNCCWFCQPLQIDGGTGLGLAVMSKLSIQLWERKSNCCGVLGWVMMQKTIQLEGMFSWRMPRDDKWVFLVGYDEDTNVIVLSTMIGNFVLQLESTQIWQISESDPNKNCYMEFYPYTNFYTTGNTSLCIFQKQPKSN